ncbi:MULTISPECIES: ABC transporter permease [Microbacterium]|uniref:Transport permease protein n=1 Tax=Microbacterium hominis TaxID=162426 RepID=A0A2K9DA00_9MICO|nr:MULTISPECIES: ABC transporter permease [Microbacterium]AUG30420.1 ABC transporter permease [Microbacterium hominis]
MFASDRDAGERMRRLAAMPLEEVGGSHGRRSSVGALRNVLSRREMLGLLIRRDLKARYKDSTLGFFWSTARPLIQLAIYFVVMGQFLQAAKSIPDFAVYVFAGLSAIGLFTEIITGATSSILNNGGLVKKVYLPREIFPLSSVGSALFNFGIQLVILLGATLLVAKPPLHLQFLYFFPALLVLVVYATAFGLLFSAVNVYLRDTQYLVEVVTMLLFWASPVVYSWEMVRNLISSPLLLEVYTNNPLTLAVLGFQRAFWVAGEAHVWPGELMLRLLVALGIGLVLLVFCHRTFVRLQGNFAQEL